MVSTSLRWVQAKNCEVWQQLKGSADLFGERDEVQGARHAELCMAIPLGGKPPSGWSSETYL
jgi:hypothetical protein